MISRIQQAAALDYNAFCRCADQHSGNFYDFIPQSNNRLAVSMGDLPAAPEGRSLNTPCLQALIRGLTAGGPSNVLNLARELNRTLYLLGPQELCVPWFFAAIDPIRHELQYVNAGHESPYLIRMRTGAAHRLERTGTPLGFSAHSIHRQDTTSIEPGDLLAIFSEGVAESLSQSELLDTICETMQSGAAEVTRRVFEKLDRSPETSPEDRTFAAVRVVAANREPLIHDHSEEALLVCAA